MKNKLKKVGVIMKYLFIILYVFGFIGTPIAWGLDCSKHKIYCKIVELRPNIDKKWAMKFSNIIYVKAKAYKMDPLRSVAIAMQESSLRQINRKQAVLVPNEVCDDMGECETSYAIVSGYSDISIWMFHVRTLKSFSIDPSLAQSSLEYATEKHFEILKHKIKACKRLGKEAWSCYHSATPRHRKKYLQLVNRFFTEKEVKVGIQNNK